ncbi:MAG: hypothetical protein PHF11_01005 [Candidatus Omnitrophica bacterium]|nr:hypothetical protein [Candidatus Omnitrophota bacterium]
MKVAAVICLVLFLSPPLLIPDLYCSVLMKDDFRSMPGPTLLYPVTDDIVLSGKDHLEFKWIRTRFAETDYFDFRLYRGYNATGQNLILKDKVDSANYPFRVPASLFENNRVYTWVLVQVLRDGEKSDRTFSSFKIVKK